MKKHSPAFLEIVNSAKANIKETDVATIAERLSRGESFLLYDVREDNEWQKAHIVGAVHVGKGIIERDIEKFVEDKDTEIVLYCGGGFRSALAADNVQKMGYTNVWSMDGGFRGWKEGNHPIEEPQD